MSKAHGHAPSIAIEWSPKRVRVYDSNAKTTREFETLREAATMIGSKPVTIALGRRNVFLRTTRLPNAAVDDLRPIVSMRLSEMFPMSSSELAFDIELLDDRNLEGRLALIAAVATNDLRQILSDAKAGNIKVARVMPVSIGSVLLAAANHTEQLAVVSDDLSGIGIDIVTGQLIRGSRVTVNSAGLSQEVCRSHQVAGLPCGDMMAAGDVVFPEAGRHTRSTPLEMLCTPQSAAIPFNIRLPEAVTAERERAKRKSLLRGGLFFAVSVLIWVYAINEYQGLQKKVNSVNASIAKENGRLSALRNKAESDANAATSLESDVLRSFQVAQPFSDVVAAITSAVPDGIWLTGLTLDRGKEVQVRGMAKSSEDVSTFTTNLQNIVSETANGKKVARFRSIKTPTVNGATIEKVPLIQFSFSLFPVGNIPFVDFAKRNKS